MESVENCASACRISVVCEVPVWVIKMTISISCTVEEVAKVLSGRELGKIEGDGVGEGDGVCEGMEFAREMEFVRGWSLQGRWSL